MSFSITSVICFLDAHAGAITAIASIAIAVFTWVLALSTKKLWRSTAAMQSTSDETLAHLKREFEAEHRPWVDVHFGIGSDLEWDSNGCRLTLIIHCGNFGASPAIDVVAEANLILGQDPAVVQRDISERVRSRPVARIRSVGGTIYRERQLGLPQTVQLSMADVDKWRKLVGEGPGVDAEIREALAPTIVGCVDYRSPFDTKTRHQTGFILDLRRTDPQRPGEQFTIKVGENVPADRLTLIPSIFGDGIID